MMQTKKLLFRLSQFAGVASLVVLLGRESDLNFACFRIFQQLRLENVAGDDVRTSGVVVRAKH